VALLIHNEWRLWLFECAVGVCVVNLVLFISFIFSAKEPLNIGHSCGKCPTKIRDPMSLRHSVPIIYPMCDSYILDWVIPHMYDLVPWHGTKSYIWEITQSHMYDLVPWVTHTYETPILICMTWGKVPYAWVTHKTDDWYHSSESSMIWIIDVHHSLNPRTHFISDFEQVRVSMGWLWLVGSLQK